MMPNTKQQSGFSLVEVLVAITILLLVIVGPLQIISRSISSTNFATEQINAWFLAQEGIELAQKGRDDLVLEDFEDKLGGGSGTNPMSDFLSDYSDCFTADGCGLNIGDGTTLATPVTCGTVSNCRLYLTSSSDNDRSSYQHSVSGNTITPYTRVVRMERTPATGTVREIKVTSTVTWRTGSLISGQRVEAVSYLFNVYDTD
ncbi:prepilin-type N-terminal cleavage/methylation domain-containing protein [Patescibacteria group bacterium]|nr:prepilin-type N-terminal cleavage/methylation domain-containing protein [Patescibacteria group bacterium]